MSRALSDLFDRALAFGGHTHTRADIAEGIKIGRYHYFGDDRCAVVAEIVEYPQDRKLNVFLAAGDYSRIMRVFVPKLKSFAIDNGCSSLTTTARHGFLRRLPAVGWKPTHTVFELKLEGK